MSENIGIHPHHCPLLKAVGYIALLTSCYLPAQLSAAEMRFIPRASFSFASYDFTQSARPNALSPTGINDNNFPEVDFSVTFKIFGVGGTLFKDSYYLDLSYQQSLEEEDTFRLEDPNIQGGAFEETFEGDRKDYSITLGKKFLDNQAGIYVGYKAGESDAAGNQGEHLNFKEKGYFVGINYGWRITKNNVLSFNLAYADLDGDLKEEVNNPAFSTLDVPLDTDASSDAQGLSYGVSWSSRITEQLSYSLALDARKYTFENVKDANPNAIPSDEFKEEFISATLSLYYLF